MERNTPRDMVNRVKATMEIEGLVISKGQLETLKFVAEGKLDAEELINKRKQELLSRGLVKKL